VLTCVKVQSPTARKSQKKLFGIFQIFLLSLFFVVKRKEEQFSHKSLSFFDILTVTVWKGGCILIEMLGSD